VCAFDNRFECPLAPGKSATYAPFCWRDQLRRVKERSELTVRIPRAAIIPRKFRRGFNAPPSTTFWPFDRIGADGFFRAENQRDQTPGPPGGRVRCRFSGLTPRLSIKESAREMGEGNSPDAADASS